MYTQSQFAGYAQLISTRVSRIKLFIKQMCRLPSFHSFGSLTKKTLALMDTYYITCLAFVVATLLTAIAPMLTAAF